MYNLITEEFHGSPIDFRQEDAWVNLTQMCAAFGKRPNDFLALPATKAYVEELKNDAVQLPENLVIEFIETRRGQHGSGTWAHPDLALECARWLSPAWSIKCNRIIRRLLNGETIQGSPHNPMERRMHRQTLRFQRSKLQAELQTVRRQFDSLRTPELEGHVPIQEWIDSEHLELSRGQVVGLGRRLAVQARLGQITSGAKTIPVNNKARFKRVPTYTPEAIGSVFASLFPAQLALG